MEQVQKPSIPSDIDGNIFVIIGAACKALRNAGLGTVDEMSERVKNAGSYDEALQIVMEYVEFS